MRAMRSQSCAATSADVALIYCDSSALVKLVVSEAESEALQTWLLEQPEPVLVSSVIARTEVVRAVRRVGEAAVAAAGHLMASVSVVHLDAALADSAGAEDPPMLRSLDAIHLRSARRLGSTLAAFVAYDTRLVEAAQALQITVVRPGADPSPPTTRR